MNQNPMLAVLVFYPFLGGLACYAVGRKNERRRDFLANFVAVSEFLFLAVLAASTGSAVASGAAAVCTIPAVCGFGLNFTLDGFRLVYCLVAALMWMMSTLCSREYFLHHDHRNRYYLFLLLTLGATMGVFLSADLYTTFLFFEIMSFTSYVWVVQEETRPALRAADTYLAVAVLGGLVMLMGIFLVYHELGTLAMDELLPAARACPDKKLLFIAGLCMLFGFGAKAGAFPLHIWLPKAHPVAPAPASALLSGILTKAGIFGILIISCNLFLYDAAWGALILAIGVLTMLGGAVLAVFSIDLKRTLACSSMSQIGFILVGIGMQCLLGEENALAVHGTLLHMVNHSLIKLVLFLAAGVIYMNTHSLDLNEIRGFGRNKPLLKAIFLIGALAIGGVPLFCGYISKTLLHESILEYGGGLVLRAVEYTFLFCGGLTVAYMTKLFAAIFLERNADPEVQRKFDRKQRYMDGQTRFALTGSAAVLLIWGLFPRSIMDRAAQLGQGLMHLSSTGQPVAYFSLTNLAGSAVSVLIGALVYLLVVRRLLMKPGRGTVRAYVNLWPQWLDLEDRVYRPVLLRILPSLCAFPFTLCARLRPIWFRAIPTICAVGCRVLDSFPDLVLVGLRKSIYRDSPLPYEPAEGNAVTLAVGKALNRLQRLRARIFRRQNPATDYVHVLAVKYTEFKENSMLIGRSLSFGLMLAGIGLCLMLIYLILW